MSWHKLERDGVRLAGFDGGSGLPAVFQHGLGGDEAQLSEVFPQGFRRLTLECRGHGRSSADDPRNYSIATFGGDVLAFADVRGVERFVAGGISMGAAIALRLAARHPERIIGLVLARPAWLWNAAPDNMRPYAEVAEHLANPDAEQARANFESSETARRLAHEAPGNLDSMRKFLQAKDRAGLSALLSAIAEDGPCLTEADVRSITVPTLVIGADMDLAHPMAFAETLAATIGGAWLVKITPKSSDARRYVAEFRTALSGFLSEIAPSKGPTP